MQDRGDTGGSMWVNIAGGDSEPGAGGVHPQDCGLFWGQTWVVDLQVGP